MRLTFPLLVAFLFLFACESSSTSTVTETSPESALELPDQPNILWIVAEDLGPYMPSFGDSTIQTPALSRLADEGVCYDNLFSQSPVCAPARFGIATGMYPNHLGAMHMRTGPWYASNVPPEVIERAAQFMPPGITPYEPILPAEVMMMSEYLRRAGYYCSNNAKEDYQFRKPLTAWDESSGKAHWRKRAPGQPFFAIFNIGVTHESQIWAKAEDSLWVAPDLEVEVPPYLPDNEIGQRDVRRMYSNIKEMDYRVAEILAELEADNLLDSTIVMWYTDHGGPLPRQKRLLYDSGLHVPMIIRYPEAQRGGTRDDQLISFIDFAPTALSLAGIPPPDYMDGQAFLGPHQAPEQRRYVHAHADRFDESYDTNRAVRDKRYKYIRYYQPDKPMFLPIAYREQMPIMQELQRLRKAGELTEAQAQWFRPTKPEEDLFDTWEDPHELKNLAKDPEYADKLAELRAECERWTASIEDKGMIEETALIEAFWPGQQQPQTAMPEIKLENGKALISCGTAGASIAYKIILGEKEPDTWMVYTQPVDLPEGAKIKAVAQRIGYQATENMQ